jgi:hypothetical protein
MNKRAFLKLFSAVMSWPVVSPVLAWAAGSKLKNWAAISNTARALSSANSLEEVRTFVKQQGSSRFSAAAIASTPSRTAGTPSSR